MICRFGLREDLPDAGIELENAGRAARTPRASRRKSRSWPPCVSPSCAGRYNDPMKAWMAAKPAALGARDARADAEEVARAGVPLHHDSGAARSTGCTRPTTCDGRGLRPGHRANPGEFPYTRGIHATGYRGKLWTMRQFAGFGTPERDERSATRPCCQAGGTGPERGVRPADADGAGPGPPARRSGEVGKCGVSVTSLADMETLFDGIPRRRHHDVDDDQLAGGDALRDVPGGGGAAGRRLGHAVGDDPERHPEGVHRAEGIHLPAAAVDAAHHRHLRVLRAAKCRGGTRSRSAATTSARRVRRRCRSWPSRCATASSTSSGASMPGWTSTSSCRGSPSSSTRTATSSRRSRSTGRPAGSGRA